jgi:putative hydrolase of the HAD superfamily
MAERGPELPLRVSHVAFDVDGTLVDFVGAIGKAWAAAAERIAELTSMPLPPSGIAEERERVRDEPEWRSASASELRDETMRRLLARGGIEGDVAARALAELNELLVSTRDASITVYEDVRPALEALRRRGFVLAAASNGSMDLDAIGLGGYFERFQSAEAVGLLKPDPRFFSRLVRDLGVPAERVVAVGDRWDNDVEPAIEAGLPAVLLDREGAIPRGSGGDGDVEAAERARVPRVRTLLELPRLLERATTEG